MSAAEQLGVTPAGPPAPARIESVPLGGAAPAPPEEAPPTWPPALQRLVVGLLVVLFALVCWHAYAGSRFAARPLELHRGRALDRIDLNAADRADLQQLPGIGAALAERILAERERVGEFRSLDDLRKVKGIGPVGLERLRPLAGVGPSREIAPS